MNAYLPNTHCEKCGHVSHCDKECLHCANDVCTGCKCIICEPNKEKYNDCLLYTSPSPRD